MSIDTNAEIFTKAKAAYNKAPKGRLEQLSKGIRVFTSLNFLMPEYSAEDLLASIYLEATKDNPRPKMLRRLHGRYNSLRGQLERQALDCADEEPAETTDAADAAA